MTKISRIGQTEGADYNPNRSKTPEERVEDVKQYTLTDKVELSEVARVTLGLNKAEAELKLLPTSEFWQKRVWELKTKLEELKGQ